MSSRSASCPSCGGEVLFRAGSSLVAVCSRCRAAVARKGVDLTAIGKVAELVPTTSPFRIGMEGTPRKGYRPFRIVGRLQLSTGEGTWDEWHVAFDDGRYGWLAEAQGAFWLTTPLPTPRVPAFEALEPGARLDLPPYGAFTVSERREALYASAEGELPFETPPGTVFAYADLSGEGGSVATVDYGDGPGAEAFFVGRKVELADLGIPDLAKWTERKAGARASSLNCPSCGGALELKDPAATVRIACPYCGSLLGTDSGAGDAGKFEVLERLREVPFHPSLPLGADGTLEGRPYVLLGALRKSCEVEDETYHWNEYLLKETKSEAYHWLVESNGHWSLVRPAASPVERVARFATLGGRRYRHFQATTAKVEAVLGEFYWTVARGDAVRVEDFIDPPRILSSEKTENEVTWSEGVYLPREELEKGFALKEPLAAPEGVGANQPWPHAAEAPFVKGTAFVLAVTALALFVLFHIRDDKKVVFERELPLVEANDALAGKRAADVKSGPRPADENVVLTEPFEIEKSGNLEARVEAPTDNTWVTVGASLIEEATGETRSFAITSDYYHGVDGGESWSEGARSRNVFISRVPAGRYVLRLDPEFEPAKAPMTYKFRLRSRVPRTGRFVLVLFLVALGPLLLGLSKLRFESRRWAESDTTSGDVSGSSSGWTSQAAKG